MDFDLVCTRGCPLPAGKTGLFTIRNASLSAWQAVIAAGPGHGAPEAVLCPGPCGHSYKLGDGGDKLVTVDA